MTDPDPELGGGAYDDPVPGGKGGKTDKDKQEVTKLERWLGPWLYIVPVITAIGLLFAATCSADGWRVKVNVVRVDLPNDIFARLLSTGKGLGKTGSGAGGNDDAGKTSGLRSGPASGKQMESRASRVVAAGYLSVGFWGWCVSRFDHSE